MLQIITDKRNQLQFLDLNGLFDKITPCKSNEKKVQKAIR